VVVIARQWAEGDYVSVDNVATGRMVAQHLLRLGHRRIACVYLREPGHTAVRERLAGFTTALSEAGVENPPEYLIETSSLRVEEGIRAADAFLKISPRPDAAFVISDVMAVGFVDRLLSLGVRVPQEVAVVGHDDIRYSAFLKVPLTTVALPKHEIGQIAAEILLDRTQGHLPANAWRQVLLQPELIIRASCGSNL
jgi:LacI family transcriptional regulator